jgi:uncharacterized DUF497 family protein
MEEVDGPDLEFDWDEANIGHLARHNVSPEEAEQVILSDPVDLGIQMVEGEERLPEPRIDTAGARSAGGHHLARRTRARRHGF